MDASQLAARFFTPFVYLHPFVESTINQVVSKRFVKRQQMQWSQKGAHLLLQTRTKVLDGDLEGVVRGWYPQFRAVLDASPNP